MPGDLRIQMPSCRLLKGGPQACLLPGGPTRQGCGVAAPAAAAFALRSPATLSRSPHSRGRSRGSSLWTFERDDLTAAACTRHRARCCAVSCPTRCTGWAIDVVCPSSLWTFERDDLTAACTRHRARGCAVSCPARFTSWAMDDTCR
jgi:hypothetical protein